MGRLKKEIKAKAGVTLIISGTLLLLLTRIPSLSTSNALLASGLLLIASGIVLHIWSIKRESLY